ncbi:hypothetical protein MASR1M32_30750 [Rhodobacter sp.]
MVAKSGALRLGLRIPFALRGFHALFLLPLALTCLFATPALTEGKSIIVLDASGSMWGQIDGRAKLEIAREALGRCCKASPPIPRSG